ncbi:MAG TPA: hypothetical protein VK685_11015 [Candidatus Acidoferrum sp.]|nr:hypothetical protein [Candidatus Acidoferrum sp.]
MARACRSPVFENLEAGATIEDIMSWFDLSRERSLAAPDYY